jgi:hypothetical protein
MPGRGRSSESPARACRERLRRRCRGRTSPATGSPPSGRAPAARRYSRSPSGFQASLVCTGRFSGASHPAPACVESSWLASSATSPRPRTGATATPFSPGLIPGSTSISLVGRGIGVWRSLSRPRGFPAVLGGDRGGVGEQPAGAPGGDRLRRPLPRPLQPSRSRKGEAAPRWFARSASSRPGAGGGRFAWTSTGPGTRPSKPSGCGSSGFITLTRRTSGERLALHRRIAEPTDSP